MVYTVGLREDEEMHLKFHNSYISGVAFPVRVCVILYYMYSWTYVYVYIYSVSVRIQTVVSVFYVKEGVCTNQECMCRCVIMDYYSCTSTAVSLINYLVIWITLTTVIVLCCLCES